MNILSVFLEINGIERLVGHISYSQTVPPYFQYDPSYLSADYAVPISFQLPLQPDAFSSQQTALFFEGLLPEGYAREAVAQWMHVDHNNYISILAGLGKECLGAVRIVDDTSFNGNPEYIPLHKEEIRKLAAEGATKSTEILVETHLSLTGASGKVGLYYDQQGCRWYFPKGSAPSTHIVKQSHVRYAQMVINEMLSLNVASALGIDVVDHFIIESGGKEDQNILFATKRYDRLPGDTSRMIDSLPVPFRLHQEDLCQALGIPASEKYETVKSNYLGRIADFIIMRMTSPYDELAKLYRMIVFHYLIGNNDGHLKNFSLLYNKDLSQVTFTPAYDIISTAAYGDTTRKMSLFIGEHNHIREITHDDFMMLASEMGLGKKMAESILAECAGKFESAMRQAAIPYMEAGYPHITELMDQILLNGGYASLN